MQFHNSVWLNVLMKQAKQAQNHFQVFEENKFSRNVVFSEFRLRSISRVNVMPSNSVLCASGKFFTFTANTCTFHAERYAAGKGADRTQVLGEVKVTGRDGAGRAALTELKNECSKRAALQGHFPALKTNKINYRVEMFLSATASGTLMREVSITSINGLRETH